MCVCVSVCVIFPALPGRRGAGCAGRWIVLLGCGPAVSLLLLRMNVGDRGRHITVSPNRPPGATPHSQCHVRLCAP